MTRINCIYPATLLDEWLAAHLREGLRPINNVLYNGRDNIDGSPQDWKLGEGHEKFHRAHLPFTLEQWEQSKAEYIRRGGTKFNFDTPNLDGVDNKYMLEYTPTTRAKRENIARLCRRWRKRGEGRRHTVYHFEGEVVDNIKSFRQYISWVKIINRV